MIGSVCGPIGRSMPSLMSGLPARPMPTIRPSLIPMSALTTPMVGSTTTTPAITASSSRWRRPRLVLGHPARGVLGVAPERLVARAWRSRSTRIHRSVSPSRTRSPVGGPVAGDGRSRERRVTVRPRRRPIRAAVAGRARRPAVSPGAQRTESPGREVEPEPARRRPVERQARVHPLERVVGRHAHDPRRSVRGR